MTLESEDYWVEVVRYDTRAAAAEHALVLAAMGIEYRLMAQESGLGLHVAAEEVARARQELAAYDEENQPRPAATADGLGKGLDGALIYGAVIVLAHAASDRQAFSQDWWSAGAAQAGLIVDGEWWRVVTALGLHVDAGHLIANLVAGGLFGVFLAHRLGAGLAWLATLLAGAAGNALNALVQPDTHAAVGASTAVFGALGLLAALTWRREASQARRGLRRWLPLAAGVVLLAFLGVGGERTDVGAHIAGFLAGCVLGTGVHAAERYLPKLRRAQCAYGAAAIALFALAWLVGLTLA